MRFRCALGVVALSCFPAAVFANPITISPFTEYLHTGDSTVDVPGVGPTNFNSGILILTTNADHEIAFLGGGTLAAVGDSVTIPIQLTAFDLTSGVGTLTTMGTQPIGSITLTYTRENEGGTFTGTLPVNLTLGVSDTLTLSGDWSEVPPTDVLGPGPYLGDVDGSPVLFNENGAEIHDQAVTAGPEPGTIGLVGLCAGLVPLAWTIYRRRGRSI
jgi:hypothetical protein